jgi:hypothetical protein
MSSAVVPVRRARRKGPAQIGDVAPVGPSKQTTEDIVNSVRDKSRKQAEKTSALLQDLCRITDQRHRKHAQKCVEIGYAMCRPELDDWIEIGERMLANGGRR